MPRDSSRRDSKSKSSKVNTSSKHQQWDNYDTGSYTGTAGTSSVYPAPYDNYDGDPVTSGLGTDYGNSLSASGVVYDQLNAGMSGLQLSGTNSYPDDYPSDLGYLQEPEQSHYQQQYSVTDHVIPEHLPHVHSDPCYNAQKPASDEVESGSVLQTNGVPDDNYSSATPLHDDLGWTKWSPERYKILQQNAPLDPEWDSSTVPGGRVYSYDPSEEPGYLNQTKASKRSKDIDKKIAEGEKALHERVAKQEMKLDAKDPRNKYANFKVCIFRWETGGDLNVDFELDHLKRGFKKWGYEVKEFFIPTSSSEDPRTKFLGSLNTFLKGCGHRELVIFMYNGHGWRDDATGELHFAWIHEEDPNTQAWVDWKSVKRELKKAKSDVLVLMDCCFAGAASQVEEELGWNPATPKKLMRVLATCSADKPAWSRTKSLSYNLSCVLKDWVDWPEYIPLSSFYHELRDNALEQMVLVTRTDPTSNRYTTEPFVDREGLPNEKKGKSTYGKEEIYLYQRRFLA